MERFLYCVMDVYDLAYLTDMHSICTHLMYTLILFDGVSDTY